MLCVTIQQSFLQFYIHGAADRQTDRLEFFSMKYCIIDLTVFGFANILMWIRFLIATHNM
jgi:hypothetical protein